MSVVTETATIDMEQPGVPMSRLVRVELRKTYDTLAGRWLLGAIVAITALVMVIFLINADADERLWSNFVGVTATPQGILLPVLGILLVTSEWSQRTGLVTFTLEPRRSRVIVAKVGAALLLGVFAVTVALVVAAIGTVASGGEWDFAWSGIGKFVLLQLISVLQGLAFGLLILNSAAAIVAYFILPTLFNILSSLWTKMSDIQPWVDLGFSSQKLFAQPSMSSDEWWQLLSGFAIWVAAPLAIGVWRLLRAELK